MSAYVLDRKHFVAIAKFIERHGVGGGDRKLHVYHPDVAAMKGGSYYLGAAEAANLLLIANLESVAARYREQLESVPVINDRDIHPLGISVPKAAALFGPLRSLQYQSCEVDGYYDSVGYAVLISLLWKVAEVAAEEAGAEAWA